MSNFWSIIWIVVWSFLFVAYLMVFFYILMDLFRDTELSGWWKALWIAALIFMPFLTALVYLTTRGRSMAERRAAEAQQAQIRTEAYIRYVTGSGLSPAAGIAAAKKLLDDGTTSQSAVDRLKAEALA